MASTYNFGPLGQQTLPSTLLLGVGALTLTSIAYTVARILLSTFVLPGKSVRNPLLNRYSHFTPSISWSYSITDP